MSSISSRDRKVRILHYPFVAKSPTKGSLGATATKPNDYPTGSGLSAGTNLFKTLGDSSLVDDAREFLLPICFPIAVAPIVASGREPPDDIATLVLVAAATDALDPCFTQLMLKIASGIGEL
jgi:hypothetical protein